MYQATLALVDKIYLTEIKAQPGRDTFFSVINNSEWEEIARVCHHADTQHPYAYDFVELKKRRS